MKRLFFPHTQIEPILAEALQTSLGPVTLFHPLPEAVGDRTDKLSRAGRIELVHPCPGDGATLEMALQAYKCWAAEHEGQDLAGRMRAGSEIPFFDPDASARIAAEVKSGGTVPMEVTDDERLQRARLLLIMAQELDTRHRELAVDFQGLEVQERRMLEMLKGEAETDAGLAELVTGSAVANSPPLHMLRARLTAWALLALQAEDFWDTNPEICFLTDSADVLDHITEHAEAENLLDRHLMPPGSEGFRAWLANPQGQPPSAETEVPASMTAPVSMTLVRLPALAPRDWLRQLAGPSLSAPVTSNRRAESDGVLVGLVLPA